MNTFNLFPISLVPTEPTSEQLGNFEIQDLMSRYNQSEQLAGSVQKKRDDAANAIIGKI